MSQWGSGVADAGERAIYVNKRTLTVTGIYEAYQLQNIARIRILEWKPSLGAAAKVILKMIISLILALIAFSFSSSDGGQSQLAKLVAVGLLVLCGRYVYQLIKILTTLDYALILETTGAPTFAVTGKNKPDIVALYEWIVRVIENPPDQAAVYNIGRLNYVKGDQIEGGQIKQYGSGNIGKLVEYGLGPMGKLIR